MNSATAPFGSMNRDQIFCLAAWLIHGLRRYQDNAGAAMRMILKQLLSCFPDDPSDSPIDFLHRHLSRAASPERIRDFLIWLYRSAQVGEGLLEPSNGTSWAYARCWSEVEAIMTEVPNRPWTAVPPSPWLHKVTPPIAWAAFRRLAGPWEQRGSPAQLQDDKYVIEAVIARWERLDTWKRSRISCPACMGVKVNLLLNAEHIRRCPKHPARQRLLAAQRALVSANGKADVPSPAPEPEPRYGHYVQSFEAEKVLEALIGRGPNDAPPETLELEMLLAEWDHSQPGYRFVCPDCAAALETKDTADHLMTCPRHPAVLQAAQIEQELRSSLGADAGAFLAGASRQQSVRAMLEVLSTETEQFADNLHWSREGLYSKPIDERPWRATQERAEAVLAELRETATSTATDDPVLVALVRLVEANRAYLNAMREFDGGRMRQDEGKVPTWEAARSASRSLLGKK